MANDNYTHIIRVQSQTTSVTLTLSDNTRIEKSTKTVRIMHSLSFPDNKLASFLINAVNNRTRERNYFRLCLQLAKGEISDEDFDREIDENEDDYVISTDIMMPPEDINIALRLAENIKGINTLEDLQDTFSINPFSTSKAIECHGRDLH